MSDFDLTKYLPYLVNRTGVRIATAFGEELRQHVSKKIGPTARPKTVIFTDDLPKTRSGNPWASNTRSPNSLLSFGKTSPL